MQLILTIIAGLGALLFILSFFGYVISGFRHHFVTGIISMLPVLNIVTLPSLWDKNSKKFVVGFIGLVMTVGAWFMGADEGIQNLVSRGDSSGTEEVIISSAPNNESSNNLQLTNVKQSASVSATKMPRRSTSFNESNMLELPTKALYKMGFDIIPIGQINTLQGRIVQITNNDNELIEGRIKSIAPASVVVEGQFENELPIASIKQLKLMVKKSNQ